MKLTITHLKAPWPAGAAVGSVIDLPAVPAWALGKCVQAADDAEVTAGLAPADGEASDEGAEETIKASTKQKTKR